MVYSRPYGRLAQRESAAFTRQRSLVRSQHRPLGKPFSLQGKRRPRGRDRRNPSLFLHQCAERRISQHFRPLEQSRRDLCVRGGRKLRLEPNVYFDEVLDALEQERRSVDEDLRRLTAAAAYLRALLPERCRRARRRCTPRRRWPRCSA